MSKQLAARKKKGSPPSAAAAVAAPAAACTLGSGGLSTTTAFSLGHGGSSAPTARSLGLGGGSAAAARPTNGGVGMGAVTAPSSIDGSSGGGFPSSLLSMDRFPFPPSPSPAWFDAAGADPSSPGSWNLLNENPSATIVLPPEVRTSDNPKPCFAEVLHRNSAIEARPTHRKLKKDLIEHIWQHYGNKGK